MNFMYILLLRQENAFLIIEEPEAHIYPSLQKKIIEFITMFANLQDSGVLITTHSPYMLTVINNLYYAGVLSEEGQTREDLENLGFEFRISFYKNDIIEYEKKGEIFRERFLSRTMPKQRNYIETKPIDRAKYEKQNLVGLGKTQRIIKYRMDILGNYYPCEKEKFSRYC